MFRKLLAVVGQWIAIGLFANHVLAAGFQVNTVLDLRDSNIADGVCATAQSNCSLRAAVEQANALDGNDVIEIPAGDYNLSLTGANEDASASGDLDINSNIALLASDAATTRIIGAGDRVIDVQLGAVTSITRVTITGGGGVSAGGGLRNAGTLVMTSCSISGNGGDTRPVTTGGGIFNLGVLTMAAGEISGNQAQASGVIPVSGGGAYSTTGMILTGVRVSGNRAIGATASGGGISAIAPGVVQIISSAVSTNQAAFGGGISSSGADVTISASVISANSTTRSGAGLRVQGGTLNLNNTTISANSAGEDGGGVLVNAGELDTFNATITDNTADADANNTGNGGGIAQSATGIVNVLNTLLAGNRDNSLTTIAKDCSGALTSVGFNLVGSTQDCGFTSASSDQLNVLPLIGALAENGGLTPTHALLSNSPAIDRGDTAGCMSSAMQTLVVDQRGLPRPRDGDNDGGVRCDIGAFELQPPLATTSVNIISDTPDPSLISQAVNVVVNLFVVPPSTGTPTGVISVSASPAETCTITLPAISCALILTTPGARLLTASYAGDAVFAASVSAGETHVVNDNRPDPIFANGLE
jgi:hypothetical protein